LTIKTPLGWDKKAPKPQIRFKYCNMRSTSSSRLCGNCLGNQSNSRCFHRSFMKYYGFSNKFRQSTSGIQHLFLDFHIKAIRISTFDIDKIMRVLVKIRVEEKSQIQSVVSSGDSRDICGVSSAEMDSTFFNFFSIVLVRFVASSRLLLAS